MNKADLSSQGGWRPQLPLFSTGSSKGAKGQQGFRVLAIISMAWAASHMKGGGGVRGLHKAEGL